MRIQTQHTGNSRFDGFSDADLYTLTAESKGGDAAFRELYARLAGRIYAYCRCVAWRQDESDDLFQDTLSRLYESAMKRRPVTNVSGYAIKIARNLWLNLQRNRRPTVGLEHAELQLHDLPHEHTEMLDLIHTAMELLNEDYREAFYLREFTDMPYEEIAEILGISSGNVRIRVTRARERIRQILEPYIAEYETHTQRNKP